MGSARLDGIRLHRVGLGTQRVDYSRGLELQRDLHDRVASGTEPNTLLLLEHEPVFTAGSRTQATDLPDDGTPVVPTDRGGRITWHGPGQLVGYPIVRLPQRLDVVAYVRELESLLLAVSRSFGVHGRRVEGRSGVWVAHDGQPDRKVAAIGVRVSRGTTMHGFALNCDCELDWAQRIVPCGISDAGVTSLSRETGRRISVSTAADRVEAELAEHG